MNETLPAAEFKKYLPSDYRKRNVSVARDVAPHAARVNSYWDGGSISYFTLYRGELNPQSVSKHPGFPRFINQTIELQPGDVLVETGFFCGKTATARITFIKDAPKALVPDEAFRAQRNHDMGDAVRESLGISPVA